MRVEHQDFAFARIVDELEPDVAAGRALHVGARRQEAQRTGGAGDRAFDRRHRPAALHHKLVRRVFAQNVRRGGGRDARELGANGGDLARASYRRHRWPVVLDRVGRAYQLMARGFGEHRPRLGDEGIEVRGLAMRLERRFVVIDLVEHEMIGLMRYAQHIELAAARLGLDRLAGVFADQCQHLLGHAVLNLEIHNQHKLSHDASSLRLKPCRLAAAYCAAAKAEKRMRIQSSSIAFS